MVRPSEEIKDRLDIVEFIKGYIELRQSGKNFKALCPFHQEKTPSFMVSPERQIWHCFGCGEGGDVFKFLMKYENLEFYEALRVLAEKAGVELKKLSPADERQFGILYDANSAAAEFFENALKRSEKAKEYLVGRGLKGETAKDFAIGYAPNGGDELTVHLIGRGFSIDDLVRAGLALKTERGQHIDRFRGRIMFPIHNHFGKVIGFSGRILPELDTGKAGKYINSPDTPIFNKSRILYGFWQSKRPIHEEGQALLVEGQMDFLMTWQDGVKNVVATSGTALTRDHLIALRRLTNKLIIGFDIDEAGQMASERSIDLAGANDFTVYILPLGEFDDPAEAVFKKPGFIKESLENVIPAMEYYLNRYLKEENLISIDKKKFAIRAILVKIKTLWSPVERAYWISEVSHKTNTPEENLIDEMDRLNPSGEKVVTENRDVIEKRELGRHEVVAERLLSLIAAFDKSKRDFGECREYMPTEYKSAYDVIVDGADASPGTKSVVDLVSLRSGFLFDNFPDEKLDSEIHNLIRELSLEYLKKKREAISAEIASLEENGDDKALGERLKEFDDILRKMQDIEHASQK